MPIDIETIKKQLASMENTRKTFMESYLQADGACQALAGLLKMAEQETAVELPPTPKD